MKNSKKAYIVFKRILFVLIILFIINFVQSENNYYQSEKTILTEEKIKEFEEDIEKGNYIDIKNYIETNDKNTSNFISEAGYNLGKSISEFLGIKLVDFFEFISKFIS